MSLQAKQHAQAQGRVLVVIDDQKSMPRRWRPLPAFRPNRSWLVAYCERKVNRKLAVFTEAGAARLDRSAVHFHWV
jgi:hypothetical protein